MRVSVSSVTGGPALTLYRPQPPARVGAAHHRRRPAHEITAEYEDAGLFRNALCDVIVRLTPQMRRNDRGDLVVRGFVDEKYEIDVLFAGRRTRDAIPLERRLRSLIAEARRLTPGQEVSPDSVRLPVRVEGAWRKRLQRDASGWETGTHHLVAARWAMEAQTGSAMQFGEQVIGREGRTGAPPPKAARSAE
ncbi:hypothetical protein [Roseobacter ponti]|uniref:hypothetical protein n=1 Tax=Roseobacter ponti TaxID=1891787 RepID=UPI00197F2BA3|nr:hypothetical protein [Roseobacter ponti]